MIKMKAFKVILTVLSLQSCAYATPSDNNVQTWSQQPRYQEVNPGGEAKMECLINDIRGECRWEKDGIPLTVYPGKYEWAGRPESGDCSLKVIDAQLEYDDGVWQCQVTPSSFKAKDALISEGAQLVVRESPSYIGIHRVGDSGGNETIASAGEDVELECVVGGANPPAKVRWFARGKEVLSGHTQSDVREGSDGGQEGDKRTFLSVSRLTLPVSKGDDGAEVRCEAEHPTLERPILAITSLNIHYPPTVTIETSRLGNLEDRKDAATLRCVADANPPARVVWRKEGLDGSFSNDPEIVFSPVTRHSAGVYGCTAENALGLSKAEFVELDVKFAPSILSVGPSKVVEATMNSQLVLNCEAEGNPEPRYQWLQKLPSQQVLIRGYEKTLVVDAVNYDHQGEFVCKALNVISGEKRSVQSEPVTVKVSGAPQVMKYRAEPEVRVRSGEDAKLSVTFCADPMPKPQWHLGDRGSSSSDGNGGLHNIILASGTQHGRFLAEQLVRSADGRENCYVSALRINGAHSDDSRAYELRLENEHGQDSHVIKLVVRNHVSQEQLIAVLVGAILTLLLLIMVIVYCCNLKKCCCAGQTGKGKKPADIESDRTDVESTHSSNVSGFPNPNNAGSGDRMLNAAIPPDALYATSEKFHIRQQQQQQQYYNMQQQQQHIYGQQQHDAMFNDSKESLRPDLACPPMASYATTTSNLNRTASTSSELNQHHQQQRGVSYNDLCFPKTSNYGSMKKKKSHNVGVNVVTSPRPSIISYYS